MVDYSKWDHMDFGDSYDEENDNSHRGPRVTSLDSPGSVTIGTDGSLEIAQSSSPSNYSRRAAATSDVASMKNLDQSVESVQSRKKRKLQQRYSRLCQNGGHHLTTIRTEDNTDITLPIYWTQDRYTVSLRLGFPALLFPSKSISVRVTGALRYKDRFAAVGSGAMSGYKTEAPDECPEFGSIEIVSLLHSSVVDKVEKDGTLLLRGKLPRPIYLNQDEDEVEYDIEDYDLSESNNEDLVGQTCDKLVMVNLPKAVPMEGMIIWWECPLLGFPRIDVSSIKNRSLPVDKVMSIEEYNVSMERNSHANLSHDATNNGDFERAWNDAHRMFREKAKTRSAEELNVDD